MHHQDVILVHDTNKPRESRDGCCIKVQNKLKVAKVNKQRAKVKKNKSKKLHQQGVTVHSTSIEEYKLNHSMRLTRIHEEAKAQLK